ncbi:MAG: fumarylacetoacetate hydrolase family protein [Bacteroidota bacterium]|nr:fumarylacetoacetate hydrolase family protein [Bacteroidota bacterium]
MKIICVGRNYGLHAKELGNEIPDKPVIFSKPDTALLKNNEPFYHPDFSHDIHHELELVVKIDKVGKSILPQFASKYYSQVTVGIDFTARDLQNELKTKGLPWELAKAFDNSAVIGEFITLGELDIQNLDIQLIKNEELVQTGNTKDMLFNVDTIIAFVSKYFTLKTGDLIFTGTPAGVSKVNIGDQLQGYLNHQKLFDFEIK